MKIIPLSNLLLFTIVLLSLSTNTLFAQKLDVRVQISNIKSSQGQLILRVFKDNESFSKSKAYKSFFIAKQNISNGTTIAQISLEPGVYGIALLDDENKNSVMEKNVLGIPKEGFGFSNFYLEKLQRPSFDDFKFELKSDSKISIKVKYL